MTPLLADLASWWLQAGLLLGAGLVLPSLVRLRDPDARLRLGQLLVAAALLVPLVQPAGPSGEAVGPAAEANLSLSLLVTANPSPAMVSVETLVVALLAAGATLRLGWLGAGLCRLRALRRRAHPLSPLPPAVAAAESRTGTTAEVLVSTEVASPVTLGWFRPAILLPEGFSSLGAAEQEAVACHELLHVRRRDSWAVLLEEGARALLWAQPAAWGVLSGISLYREEAVDRAVVESTGDRRAYLRALASLARLSQESPAAALPFQTRSHLVRRLAQLVKEVPMSRTHVFLATAGAAALLLIVGAAGASAFPFGDAPPKPAAKAAAAKPGVDEGMIYKVGGDVKAPVELTRVQPTYPEDARKNRIQGVVKVEAVIDETGHVKRAEASWSDGDLDESLITAALETVKKWTYEPATKNGKPVKVRMTITVSFKLS
jgi:TonB family protein